MKLNQTRNISPADAARERRNQKSAPRGKLVDRQVTASTSMARPQIVMRSSSGVLTAAPRTQPKASARRQTYYKVGEHTELRMPALPVIKVGYRLVSGILFAGMTTILILLLASPTFQVKGLGLAGNKRINKADVVAALNLENKSIFTVDPEAIASELSVKFPEFTDVRISFGLPAEINIAVRERKPVLAWETNGKVFWLDGEGVVMPARGEMDALLTIHSDSNVPTLEETGVTKADKSAVAVDKAAKPQNSLSRIDQALFVKIVKFSEKVPAGASLTYTQDHGFGWTDTKGRTIFVGFKLDNIDLKMAEAHTILDELENRGKNVSILSVEHEHSPYYRE